MPHPPEIIFLDAAGTLIHLPRGVGFHYADVAARNGLTIDPALLNTAFRAAWVAAPRLPATCQPRPDDDREWWRDLVLKTFQRAAGEGARLRAAEFFDELYTEFSRSDVWELYRDVIPALDALAAHSRLGIISNFDQRLSRILEGLGIAQYFSVFVVSTAVGADKPHPWIFESALAKAGVPADRALHAGDEFEADVQGPIAIGMPCFHVDRPKVTLLDLVDHLRISRESH